MIQDLKDLIQKSSLRGYVRALKERRPDILNWIMEETKYLPENAEVSERVYLLLNPEDSDQCKNGNRKIFNTLNKGYRFCASNCLCRKEEQSRKMLEHHKHLSKDDLAKRFSKQKATIKERYGVDNAALIEGATAKAIATSLNNHGGIYHTGSERIRAKIRQTNLKRHGGEHHMASRDVRDKIKATNQKRYGSADTMHLARTAFKEQTGVSNPFMLEEIKSKARKTMIERYGFPKALQNSNILQKMIEDTEKEWGVSNIALRPDVRRKINETIFERYNRYYVNQDHISDEIYDLLQDKDKFTKLFETMSLREVAIYCGLSYDGCRKYTQRYGIDLSKSSYEPAIVAFLEMHGAKNILKHDRKIIKPYELDIVIPDTKVAIEFNGLYFHGDIIKDDKNYHRNKLKAANEAGYRLIQIFEDEWLYQESIVKSRLLNILGLGERGIGARKTIIKEISHKDANEFLKKYHIQGAKSSSIRYGAFYNDVLISVMTFSKYSRDQRKRNTIQYELDRFATDGKSYAGLASRIFKAFIKDYSPDTVLSYADLRYSEGDLYRKLGFDDLGETDIGYSYVHKNSTIRENRQKYQKNMIKDRVENGKDKSEFEIMVELGYYKIWDCGHKKFLWKSVDKKSQ